MGKLDVTTLLGEVGMDGYRMLEDKLASLFKSLSDEGSIRHEAMDDMDIKIWSKWLGDSFKEGEFIRYIEEQERYNELSVIESYQR